MKNKGYITAIMLVSVLIATFIVRIFFIQNMMNKINVDEALLELAMLEENGIEIVRIFANGFSGELKTRRQPGRDWPMRTTSGFFLSFCMRRTECIKKRILLNFPCPY